MIPVSRDHVPQPAALTAPNGKGMRENKRVLVFYNDPTNVGKKYPTKSYLAYKDDTVKAALKKMFHSKCAYCESVVTHVTHLNIEHYRPKGAVTDSKGNRSEPGYYWLAATWHNLLLACPLCNQNGSHDIAGAARRRTGKLDHFPLKDESKRARKPTDDLAQEVPLLLNPCSDNPASHLIFTADGLVSHKSDPGLDSIRIYGLDRLDLSRQRWRRALDIQDACANVEARLDDFQALKPDDAEYAHRRAQLLRAVQRLYLLLRRDEPYLAVSRPLADPTLQRVVPVLRAITAKT